jgi:Holliday junction resolvase RusA-like endonuclease
MNILAIDPGTQPISATILVEPVAKGRPRVSVVNGNARAYTPKKTANAETAIAYDIRHQMPNVPDIFFTSTPIKLTAIFYRPRPKHLPKRVTMPVTKPDLDNYVKLLEDALNGYAFRDDSQITTMTVTKRFAAQGEVPRIELTLEVDNGH